MYTVLRPLKTLDFQHRYSRESGNPMTVLAVYKNRKVIRLGLLLQLVKLRNHLSRQIYRRCFGVALDLLGTGRADDH